MMDDAVGARGNVAQEGPAPNASDSGDGLVERQPAAGGNPLTGGMLGPLGKLSSVQILGGDTMVGLPIVGDLIGDGLSLNTLNALPVISDVVNQIGAQEGGKPSPALGHLATVGNLGRMLLGAESTSAPTESAAAPGALVQHATDKAKVTPELMPLFGPDVLGTQELSGVIYQLPLAG
jgi:hypothetical protein